MEEGPCFASIYRYLLPDLAWKMKAFSSSGNRMRWSRLINASFLDEGSAQHDVFGQHAMQIRWMMAERS